MAPILRNAPEKDSKQHMKSRAMDSLGFSTWRPCKQLFAAIGTSWPVRISQLSNEVGFNCARASLTYCNVSTVAVVNVRNSSNVVANTALGVPHADQIRSYWASESSMIHSVGPPASYWATRRRSVDRSRFELRRASLGERPRHQRAWRTSRCQLDWHRS
jgi:hypothetical protein